MIKFSIFNFQFSINDQFSISKRGFSFIDVLIGVSLFVIVFLGIFAAFQLGLKVVGRSQRRIAATALANAQIEKIRNLPYDSIGIVGGFPEGELVAATSTVLNNIDYTIEQRVDFIVDSADGLASPNDDCPNDYKKAQVRVSWAGLFEGEVVLTTDIAPENLAQECGTGGGILSISVFDAFGIMVPSPLIEIKDPSTDTTLKTATPVSGQHYFSLATSTYKVVVSKPGYSIERTYGEEEIATPEKPHPIVIEGLLVENSFSIDKLSSFSVDTLSPWGIDYFSDTFDDETKISELSNLVVQQGRAGLASTSDGYVPSGYLISIPILPFNPVRWDQFSFSDSEPPETDLKYQFYYATDTDWFLVPEPDLPGNMQGFDLSPVDLSGLPGTNYPKLKLKANFSSSATSSTPFLDDWQASWITNVATPISNVSFDLRGDKIIGTDGQEEPVYKYSSTKVSDATGHIDIASLEWDSYTFSVEPATDLDLLGTEPSPQPISLAPDSTVAVDLYLQAENSLLLTLQNVQTLEPIFASPSRLYSGDLTYNKTLYTDEDGQAYFSPLEPETYTLELEAPGYLPATTTVAVSGDMTETVRLEQVE